MIKLQSIKGIIDSLWQILIALSVVSAMQHIFEFSGVPIDNFIETVFLFLIIWPGIKIMGYAGWLIINLFNEGKK